jgi:hypothetical protein
LAEVVVHFGERTMHETEYYFIPANKADQSAASIAVDCGYFDYQQMARDSIASPA